MKHYVALESHSVLCAVLAVLLCAIAVLGLAIEVIYVLRSGVRFIRCAPQLPKFRILPNQPTQYFPVTMPNSKDGDSTSQRASVTFAEPPVRTASPANSACDYSPLQTLFTPEDWEVNMKDPKFVRSVTTLEPFLSQRNTSDGDQAVTREEAAASKDEYRPHSGEESQADGPTNVSQDEQSDGSDSGKASESDLRRLESKLSSVESKLSRKKSKLKWTKRKLRETQQSLEECEREKAEGATRTLQALGMALGSMQQQTVCLTAYLLRSPRLEFNEGSNLDSRQKTATQTQGPSKATGEGRGRNSTANGTVPRGRPIRPPGTGDLSGTPHASRRPMSPPVKPPGY